MPAMLDRLPQSAGVLLYARRWLTLAIFLALGSLSPVIVFLSQNNADVGNSPFQPPAIPEPAQSDENIQHELPPDKGHQPIKCPPLPLAQHPQHSLPLHSKVKDPNSDGLFYTRRINYDPPFFISVHEKEHDPMRYQIIEQGKYYEFKLTEAFQTILGEERDVVGARVLDVGGNVGWFTILSASMGYHVDVFEPNVLNGRRICESVRLNEFDFGVRESVLRKRKSPHPLDGAYSTTPGGIGGARGSVNYYPLGIGDAETKLTLYSGNKRNPGSRSFVRQEESNPDYPNEVISITSLDRMAEDKGWFEGDPPPAIVILKIDVEGFEMKVVEGAEKLLKSGIVRNMFMEATGKTGQGKRKLKALFERIYGAGFEVYKLGKWMGPNKDYNGPKSGVGDVVDYVADFIPRQSHVNLWFKFSGASTGLGK